MTTPSLSSLRRGAAVGLLAFTALSAQARGHWSVELNLGWPLFPVFGPVAVGLPAGAVSVQVGGVGYWHHRGTWYRPWGPRWVVVAAPLGVVVPLTPAEPAIAPPPAVEPTPRRPEPVVTPRNGQDAQQTEADRQACDRWATTQPAALADATVFQRAVEACMDGRGYTMK